MGDTSTPIVGTHKELLVPKMTHRLDLVQRHCAERVIEVAISIARAARIAASSQVRYVDREALRESRRYFVPANVSLGISMQKEHRWPIAFVTNRDGRAASANLGLHKAGKKLRNDIRRRLRWQFGQRYLRLIPMAIHLRSDQKHGGETIGRWYRSIRSSRMWLKGKDAAIFTRQARSIPTFNRFGSGDLV